MINIQTCSKNICAAVWADGYLRESSIFMRGFIKMGVIEAEGTV